MRYDDRGTYPRSTQGELKVVDWEAIKKEVVGQKGFAAKLCEQLTPQRLAEAARRETLGDPPQPVTCENLNDILCRLLDKEYEIYLKFEREIFENIIVFALKYAEHFPKIRELVQESLRLMQCDADPAEKLKQVSANLIPLHKAVVESFAQGRKSRAGLSAQYQVAYILDQIGFKGNYETQRKLNGTVDFLFPNLETWRNDRRRCTILSIKRSLRERYKQIYQELGITGGLTVYLMVTETNDEAEGDISSTKVDELNRQNIYLVVRDEIKSSRFAETRNVMGFTQFFCDELPSLRRRWK